MADIKCDFTTCVNNDSTYMDDKDGFCTKQFIRLYSSETINQSLDCKEYKWDNGKSFKSRQATPKQMSDALEGAE